MQLKQTHCWFTQHTARYGYTANRYLAVCSSNRTYAQHKRNVYGATLLLLQKFVSIKPCNAWCTLALQMKPVLENYRATLCAAHAYRVPETQQANRRMFSEAKHVKPPPTGENRRRCKRSKRCICSTRRDQSEPSHCKVCQPVANRHSVVADPGRIPWFVILTTCTVKIS